MNVTPRQLQEQLTKISDESFALHQELADLVGKAADIKIDLLTTCKNGKEVEMRFEATDTGKRIAFLKIYLRGLTAKRGALLEESKSNRGGF